MRNALGAGSMADLKKWAIQYGAYDALVLPATPAFGYATVYVLGPNNAMPSDDLVAAIQAADRPRTDGHLGRPDDRRAAHRGLRPGVEDGERARHRSPSARASTGLRSVRRSPRACRRS
jgi:hypothetical protein